MIKSNGNGGFEITRKMLLLVTFLPLITLIFAMGFNWATVTVRVDNLATTVDGLSRTLKEKCDDDVVWRERVISDIALIKGHLGINGGTIRGR